MPGGHGQFEILVEGRRAVQRKGGLWAKITRRPWPADPDVLTAILDARVPEER